MLARSDGIEGFERHVVLKRIRPELARDQRFIRMFLDEARVVASLHHQNIVQVHDIGESAGEYFIAMEYVHGEDVRKLLSNVSRQRGHVPLGYAVAIVSAAAAGLHYAHERHSSDKQPLNIVHRDVSPSNILVGYDGSIKVVDFGIATASTRQETRSGSLKGKLSYMSPEQCKGAPVDRRSDVYALGVVLYELATTTRMVKGENDYLVMEQIVTGRIPSPQFRRPGLPNELSDIIMRALATDRDRRYATADDLRLALDQYASTAGLTASSSAIAAYMRQQFGQRPEPWLELGNQAATGIDIAPPPIDESVPGNGWTELPHSGSLSRSTSSSIPRQSGPLGVVAGDAVADAATRIDAPQRQPVSSHTTPPPTNSRMGWESQPRPAAHGFPIQRAAVIGGALVAGMAIWVVARMVSSPSAPAPQVAATLPVPPPATAPPLPVAAPPPPAAAVPPPAAPEVIAKPPATTRREVAMRDPEPARKGRATGASAAARTATRAVEIAPSPTPKAAPPGPAAVSTSPGSLARSGDAGIVDTELHRPAVLSQPAPPPPQDSTPPAPSVAVQPSAPAPVVAAVVPPAALDANRISGEKRITPDEVTMDAIGRSGQETLVSSYKVCVGADGSITGVTQLKSSGFPGYDAKIQTTIRKDWRYRPFVINGKATPVCTAFRFLYSQK